MDDASIKLGIDARGAVTGEQQYRRSMESIKKSSREGTQEVDKTTGAFGRMSAQITKLTPLMAGFAASLGIREFVRVGAEMQQLNARMLAITGSASAAGEAMQFLRRTAAQQSVDLVSLADGYARLLPSVNSGALSMTEMRDIIRLTNDNMKALGLNVADQSLLFYGLSQVLGSGTVTMEDLRQVTERLPGSMQAVATSMGFTVGELREFISTGTVTAEMIKGPLIEAFRANEGAAEKMGGTLNSVFTDLKNTWRDFVEVLSDSGLLTAISKVIQTLALSFNGLSYAVLQARININNSFGDYEEAAKLTQDLAQKNRDIVILFDKLVGGIEEEKQALQQVNEIKKEATKTVKEQIIEKSKESKAQEQLNKVMTDTLTPLERYQRKVSELEGLRPFAKTAEQITAIERGLMAAKKELDDSTRSTVKLNDSFKETKKTVQEISQESRIMSDALRKTSDDIKDGFDDLFFDIYRNGRFQMGNLFDGIKDAFARMLAEMTTLAIARPIIVPLVTGIGSAMGLPGSAISGVTQSLGGTAGTGGGLFSGVGNVLGFLKGAVNDPMGAARFLTNSSASAGVNFAQGIGLGGTGQGIAGAFGAGLPGAGIGSLIGNLLGIGNQNPLISGGASLAGAAIGQALIPIPVVGGVIGSIGGQLLSGLFGGKESSKEQGAGINLATGQITSRFGLGGNKFSQENFDEVTRFAELAATIAKAFGGVNEEIFIKSNDRAGIGVGFGSADATKFFGAGEQAVEEIVKGIASRSGKLTESLQTALDNIDFTNTEQALKDLDFALQFDNLGFAEKKTSQLEEALKALNEQVEQAVATATRLGLEEGKIYQAREQAIQQLRDEFNQSIQDRILRITDPNGFALSQLDKEFATIRRDAIAIGADLAAIERAYGLERIKLVEQANDEAIRSTQSAYLEIRRFRESLQVSSSLSGLSPENRRTLALEQFRTVQVRFASGEANFQDVQSSVNNLLEASKDYYSFTEGYFKDQAEALSFLQGIEANAQVQYDAQKALLDENKRQTTILQAIADGVSRNLQQAVSAGNDARLLRPGETFQQISSAFNSKNQLPELLVRQFKLQAGFDFSAAQNQNIMFQDYARSNPAALALFNQLVQSVGGIPQYASGGYPDAGLALVGERGAELVNFKSSGSRVYNASETKGILSGVGNNKAVQQELLSLKSALVMQEERNAERMDKMINLLASISRNNQRIAYSRKQ